MKYIKSLSKTELSYCFLILLALVIYVFVSPYYRIYNSDNAWTLSFGYNWLNYGIETDVLMNDGSGVTLSGKIGLFIYIHLLELIGFTKYKAFLISGIFYIISLPIWWQILKTVGFDRKIKISFTLAMLVIEPLYNLSHQSRLDSLTFLLVSVTILLFIQKRFFLSAFACMLAFETHFVGILGAFYCLAYLLANPLHIFENKRQAIKSFSLLLVGGLCGVTIWFMLHQDYIMQYFTFIRQETGRQSWLESNSLLSYFFLTKYYRHLPELLLIIGSLVIFIKSGFYKKGGHFRFALTSSVLVVVVTLIFPRGNPLYMAFYYPAFLMLIFSVFYEYKKIWLINVIWFCLLLPQYFGVYYLEKDYPGWTNYVNNIETNALVHENAPLYGNYDMWFIYKDRSAVFFHYIRLPEADADIITISATDEEVYPDKLETFLKMLSGYDCSHKNSYTFHSREYQNWLCTKLR